jgi:hypothetical protein
LSSNALLYFNTVALDVRQNEEENKVETSPDKNTEVQSIPNSAKKSDNSKYMQYISDDVIAYYTPILFEIIDQVFTQNSPKATIKIGLIYLAKILNYYPDFTKTYLSILL